MAQISNLYIDQGCDYSVTVDVTDATGEPMDLTGYTAEAQIRRTYSSLTTTATFTTSVATNGTVTISLTNTQTTAIESGRYVYDLNITDTNDNTTRVIEGQVIITPGVTR